MGHSKYDVSDGIAYFDNLEVKSFCEYLVHDGMIGYPIAEFIKMVYENRHLWPKYKVKADRYLSVLKDHIVPKWDFYWRTIKGVSPKQGIYIWPDDGSSRFPGASLPHN